MKGKSIAARRVYRFSLFVSGATAKSARAIANIKAICDEHLPGQYQIEVVDIYQQPERLRREQVVALPTLVKQHPLPLRRFIGDLSNTERVLNGLNLENSRTAAARRPTLRGATDDKG